METTNSLAFTPLMKEAWQLTKGMKGKIWLSTLYMLIAMGIVFALFYATGTMTPGSPNLWMFILMAIITSLVYGVFLGGIMMIGVERARGLPVTYKTWTKYIKYFFYVTCVMLFAEILSNLPDLFYPATATNPQSTSTVIWNGIFTLVFKFLLLLAVIITIDQNVNPFTACWHSAKLMLKNFKLAIKVFLFIVLLTIVSMIFIFIPFIWTMPFIVLLISVFYVKIT